MIAEKPEPKGVKDTHPMETAIVEKVEHAKKPPLGSGQRFKNLSNQLARKGVKDPAALAAYIGRKNLGAAKFNALAAKGRKHG